MKGMKNKKKKNPQTVILKDVLKTIKTVKTVNGYKVRWFLDFLLQTTIYDGNIRAKIGHRECCPVTFYCLVRTGEFYDIAHTDAAARKSNIPYYRSDKLVEASDDIDHASLRKKILVATGLL